MLLAVIGLVALVIGLARRRIPAGGPARAASAWVVRAVPPRLRVARAAVDGPPAQPLDDGRAPPTSGDAGVSSRLTVRALDITGGPIAAAEIFVAPAAPGSDSADPDDDERPVGITGSDGAFTIDLQRAHLPSAGRVRVAAPGYGRRTDLYLAPALVVIKLLPENRVTGIVVEAGSGAPVPEMTVRSPMGETTSDRNGRFSLHDLPPGPLELEAFGRGWHGVPSHPIVLSIASAVEVRIEVKPAPLAIHGRITAAGQPLPKVLVIAAQRSATTDDNGGYLLPSLLPGAYDVQVRGDFLSLSRPTSVVLVDRDVEANVDVGPRVSVSVELVDLQGHARSGHEVTLAQEFEQGSVQLAERSDDAGRCQFAGLHLALARVGARGLAGRVIDLRRPAARSVRLVLQPAGQIVGQLRAPSGTPVGDLFVRAVHGPSGADFSADSSPAGKFDLGAVPAGPYRIEVRRTRAWNDAQPPLGAGAAEVRDDAVSEVVLDLAAAAGTLAGRVLDPAGRPAFDVLVTYHEMGVHSFAAGSLGLGGGIDAEVTDQDGRFQFSAVRPGTRYEIEAWTRAGVHTQLADVAADDRGIVVVLPAAAPPAAPP